ncbi:Antiviral helicase ski2 [Batrachochytrium dendrobatidis]|nr:Antiviral helicase ski2 [Batrachochytrium dendrobatidis]
MHSVDLALLEELTFEKNDKVSTKNTQDSDNGSQFHLLTHGRAGRTSIHRSVKSGIITNLPLNLGPFTAPNLRADLENAYLKPKPVIPDDLLDSCQRYWERNIEVENLLEVSEHTRFRTTLSLSRSLITGMASMADYTEVLVDDIDLNSKNSSLLQRDPAAHSDFVRGKSTSMPFVPGGLPTVVNLESVQHNGRELWDVDELLDFSGELLSIPPGFERGIQFQASNESATSLDVSKLLSGDDELLSELFEEMNLQNQDSAVDPDMISQSDTNNSIAPLITDAKDIDELLPSKLSTDAVLPKSVVNKVPIHKEWAHVVDVNQGFPEFHDLVPELAHQFPFELDIFQKRAVYHLENSESVFVAAHTSAGKTVVAEYAIALAQKRMTRAIYTSPIKALSNQKFRDFRETFDDVGILTGDVQIKPEASCLIMTTEILRSMLYRGADLIRDVEFVIFDEVHYVNDAERGVVWEEVIIMLPSHVSLILLSATVPNTKEFADWVGRTKQKDIYVISTLKRPVPLEHYLYFEKDCYKIVDSTKTFIPAGYKKAYDAVNPPKKEVVKSDSGRGRGAGRGRGGGQSSQVARPSQSSGKSYGGPSDKNLYTHLIGMLKKRVLLPAIIFTFSKRKCEEYANTLSNTDLTLGSSEKSEIHVFIERSLVCLKGSDRELPQVMRMRELLGRGIAVHHSGLLPILKEMVEILFTRGLVKVLFATETFAMGVNAPAKCVVFSMIRKHDGVGFRNLLPGEYTQMSGRAGRRGLDDTGMVIIANSNDIPDQTTLNQMILGTPTKLASQFRVTYNMILNLLRVEAIKVEDMIKRSFSENINQKALPGQQKMHNESAKSLESLQKLDCSICATDLYPFYDICASILTIGYQLHEKIIKTPIGQRSLSCGRVVIINNTMYRNALGVVLRTSSNTSNPILMHNAQNAVRDINNGVLGKQSVSVKQDRMYWVLILDEMRDTDIAKTDPGIIPVTKVSIPPQGRAKECIELLPYTAIAVITSKLIKLDADLVLDQKDTVEILNTLNQLQKFGNDIFALGTIPEYDWSKIREADFQNGFYEKQNLLRQLANYQCSMCPDLAIHYGLVHKERQLQIQISELAHSISDQNLQLLPDYHQRVDVLKCLGFVDSNSIVQIKGRVACEINTADELILTELILDNFLADYEPAEIVALLSCFVFQEKSQSEPVLTSKLEKGVKVITELAIKIAEVQHSCGLDVRKDDALAGLKFGLVEVVYEWARGLPFKHITDLTDVLEGSIVRCIVRLSETCREVSGAARLLGDAGLYKKMEEAAELIRRDIVFAASLYF